MRDIQAEIERLNAGDAREWLRLASQGDLVTAWTLSDRIRARTPPRRDASVPRHLQQIWDGTPLFGRRVLIRCYHGLGDTIQFIRYIPQVRSLAREAIVGPVLQAVVKVGVPGSHGSWLLTPGSWEFAIRNTVGAIARASAA